MTECLGYVLAIFPRAVHVIRLNCCYLHIAITISATQNVDYVSIHYMLSTIYFFIKAFLLLQKQCKNHLKEKATKS